MEMEKTIEGYLAEEFASRSKRDETAGDDCKEMEDNDDKHTNECLKEFESSQNEVVLANSIRNDQCDELTVEEYLAKLSEEPDECGLRKENETGVTVDEYLKQMEQEKEELQQEEAQDPSTKNSPPTFIDQGKSRRAIRISRAKNEQDFEHVDSEKPQQHQDDQTHGKRERTQGSHKIHRRLRDHPTENEQKKLVGNVEEDLGTRRARRRTPHHEQQRAMKVDKEKEESLLRSEKKEASMIAKSEHDKVDVVKATPRETARGSRSTSHKLNDKSHEYAKSGNREHLGSSNIHSQPDAHKVTHSSKKNRKSAQTGEEEHNRMQRDAVSSKDSEDQARDRKGSHGKEEKHVIIRDRKETHGREQGHSTTVAPKTRDRKGSHGKDAEHKGRKVANEADDKRKSFSSKGRSSTAVAAPADEKRREFKQRSNSVTHHAPHRKPRSTSAMEHPGSSIHEDKKSATLPSHAKKQPSIDAEDEPKLTPSQIRARFEAKRHNDQSRPYGTNRASKSTSLASNHSRFEKPAHDPNVSKTAGPLHSAHKVGHSHHGSSSHRSSHHGSVHDESGQHEPNHHGPSHPRTFRRELRSHHKPTSDEKPADQNNDDDVPQSTASIRSKFEAASKGNAPVRRKFPTGSAATRPGSAAGVLKKQGQTQSNKCDSCGKTVYPVEKLEADGRLFHKFCFKCTECKNTLRLGNFAALSGKIYCKPHFKQLFRLKGNYDEGFGREQHKTKWTGKTSDQTPKTGTSAEQEECSAFQEQTSQKLEENGETASSVTNGEVREVTAEA